MVKVQLDQKGLVPVIAQDADTGEVLMLGYMTPGSLKRTLESGEVWFYSRSREDLWHKGEVSGNYMKVKATYMDCDGDVIRIDVIPDGPICHTGNKTCFFTQFEEMPEFYSKDEGSGIIEELFSLIQDRKRDGLSTSYTVDLLKKGVSHISQKVIEEAGETAIAGVRGDRRQTISETADLLFHTLVLLSASNITPEDIWKELRDRRNG